MKNNGRNIFRREFLKGLGALPFLGYFAFNFRGNIAKDASIKHKDYLNLMGVKQLDAPKVRLLPSTGNANNRIRFGLIGNGWRGDQLLQSFGFIHPDQVKENTVNGKYNEWLTTFLAQEDLNIEFAGVCDTFSIHANRGLEISMNDVRPGGRKGKTKPVKIYPTYREMIEDKEIDAIRNQTSTSCNIDEGFDEAVTFNLANLAYANNKQVFWDPSNEKVSML